MTRREILKAVAFGPLALLLKLLPKEEGSAGFWFADPVFRDEVGKGLGVPTHIRASENWANWTIISGRDTSSPYLTDGTDWYLSDEVRDRLVEDCRG